MKLPTLTNSEKGFTHVLLIAVIVVAVGVAGFVGYSLVQNNKSNAGGSGTLGRATNLCPAKYKYETSTTLYSSSGKAGGYIASYYYTGKAGLQDNQHCYMLIKTGSTAGKASPTRLTTGTGKGQKDIGKFTSYAGPVYSPVGQSYYLIGEITYKDVLYAASESMTP